MVAARSDDEHRNSVDFFGVVLLAPRRPLRGAFLSHAGCEPTTTHPLMGRFVGAAAVRVHYELLVRRVLPVWRLYY